MTNYTWLYVSVTCKNDLSNAQCTLMYSSVHLTCHFLQDIRTTRPCLFGWVVYVSKLGGGGSCFGKFVKTISNFFKKKYFYTKRYRRLITYALYTKVVCRFVLLSVILPYNPYGETRVVYPKFGQPVHSPNFQVKILFFTRQ